MAIIKDFYTQQGVTATYHKLLKVEISGMSNTVTMTVAIYASAEARQSGCTPMWHEYIEMPISDFESDPRTQYYELLIQKTNSYLFGGNSDITVV